MFQILGFCLRLSRGYSYYLLWKEFRNMRSLRIKFPPIFCLHGSNYLLRRTEDDNSIIVRCQMAGVSRGVVPVRAASKDGKSASLTWPQNGFYWGIFWAACADPSPSMIPHRRPTLHRPQLWKEQCSWTYRVSTVQVRPQSRIPFILESVSPTHAGWWALSWIWPCLPSRVPLFTIVCWCSIPSNSVKAMAVDPKVYNTLGSSRFRLIIQQSLNPISSNPAPHRLIIARQLLTLHKNTRSQTLLAYLRSSSNQSRCISPKLLPSPRSFLLVGLLLLLTLLSLNHQSPLPLQLPKSTTAAAVARTAAPAETAVLHLSFAISSVRYFTRF